MSRKYKVHGQEYPYFITSTVIDWIDLFTRIEYREVIIDSIDYCRKNKGLLLYAYCIMTNHIHLVVDSKEQKLENIVRDFKSYTSHELRKKIESHPGESRKHWMLEAMYRSGKRR